MNYANKNNTKIGDIVRVPLNGEIESMHDEIFMLDYEVVLALRAKTKPEEQMVATGQEPLPEWLPFIDGMAIKQ